MSTQRACFCPNLPTICGCQRDCLAIPELTLITICVVPGHHCTFSIVVGHCLASRLRLEVAAGHTFHMGASHDLPACFDAEQSLLMTYD